MSKFLSALEVRYVGSKDEELWELITPFVYESDVAGATFTVPAGYRTDFASVPRIPLAYWLTGGKAHMACIVHDYLCDSRIVSREMTDRVFLEAMEVQEVPAWRRKTMWAAVRSYAVLSGKDEEKKEVKPEDFYFG